MQICGCRYYITLSKSLPEYIGTNYSSNTDSWTVLCAQGTQKVSPTIGGNKDSSDAVTVGKAGIKNDVYDYILSDIFDAYYNIKKNNS